MDNYFINQLSNQQRKIYKSLFEENHSIILLLNLNNFKIVDANWAACNFYGYSKKELIGKKITMINCLSEQEILEQVNATDSIKGGAKKRFKFKHRLANGSIKDVEVHSGPIELNGQKLLYSNIYDITETSRLKSNERKYQKLLRDIGVPILLVDEDYLIRLANKEAERLIGFAKDELERKKNFLDLVSNEASCERVKYYHKQRIVGNRHISNSYDITITDKYSNEKDIRLYVQMLDNNESIVVLNDITKEKILERELEHNQLQNKFFANLSHELKTPLNLIFSAIQVLNLYTRRNLGEEAEYKVQNYTNIINQNSYRLLKLVNNLIDITKIDTDNFKLSLAKYDIVKSIDLIANSVRDHIVDSGKIFNFNSQIESKIIACDLFILERIILNLLSNSIKFTEEGDLIEINLCEDEEWIVIIVKDTGIGIKEEEQKIIFNRFNRIDDLKTKTIEGSGIGLSLVELLVEMHGGEITVESKYGQGSEFIIRIPTNLEENALPVEYDTQSIMEKISVEFSDIYGC